MIINELTQFTANGGELRVFHAKTYVFWRDTGFSTVYIGSSNISESATTSGLEWNIKLSEYDSGDILEKIRATFEGYWNNPEFTPFIAALDSERLRKALRSETELPSILLGF